MKKVGVATAAPAHSMGSSADVSGISSSGPAAAAPPAAEDVPGPDAVARAAGASDWLHEGEAGGGAAAAGCRASLQLRRAALSTAASEGSWYWQLHEQSREPAATPYQCA